MKTIFNTRYTVIMYSIPALIISGCAGTAIDTAFVKEGDKVVAINENTVKENNMAVLTLEGPQIATDKQLPPSHATENAYSEDTTATSVIFTSGNPNAYTEIDSGTVSTEGGNSIHSIPPTKDTITHHEKVSELTEEQTAKAQHDNVPAISPDRYIVQFETNSTEINADALKILAEHAQYLVDNPEAHLVINGHADHRGNQQHNQKLSEERAQSVLDVLITMGVTDNQLSTNAFGESLPTTDPNDLQANRRVELSYSSQLVLSKR